MGLRFRKSIKIAPGVKLNLNKNSTSVTVGTKGNHYTVNSKGNTTKTVGIPGTGLSYSTTSSGTKPKKTAKKTKVSTVKKSNMKQSKPKKKGGCLTSCLVVLIALILIFPSNDKKDEAKEPSKQQITKEEVSQDTEPQPENVEDTTEDFSNISTEQAEQERIAAEQAEAERIAQEQAEAERIAAEQAADDAVAAQPQNLEDNFNTYNNPEQQQTASSYVLNTSTMKFHHPTCRDVKKIAPQNYSTYDGSRDDVIGQGYSPCGHCSP